MKKKIFTYLVLLTACIYGMQVQAQTDVTATYLSNAGFETPEISFTTSLASPNANATWSLAAASSKGIANVPDWEESWDGGNPRAATVTYGLSSTSWHDVLNGVNPPNADKEGNTGSGLTMSGGWGSSVILKKTVNLPAGIYQLSFDVINMNGTKPIGINKFGFVPKEGTAQYGTKTTFASSWTTETVNFTLTEETEGEISIGFTGASAGSGDNGKLYIDNIQLFYTDLLAALKADLADKITEASAVYDNGSGNEAAALNTAIQTAKTVVNNASASQAEVQEAINDLEAAIWAYKYANASESNPLDMTSFITNPGFDSGITGWTSTTGAQNNTTANNQQGDFTGNFWENWNGSAYTGKMYQTVNGLPNGKYTLRAAVFTSTQTDHDWLYLYAGNYKTAVNTTAPTFHTVDAIVTTGDLEIGIELTEAVTTWVGVDNFSLTYLGAVDITALKAALAAQLATVQAAGYADKPMNSDVAAALTSAVSQAQTALAGDNALDVTAAATQLSTAATAAEQSIAAYVPLGVILNKTESAILPHYIGFSGYDDFAALVSNVKNNYTTGYYENKDVEDAVQSLKVAEITCLTTDAEDKTSLIFNPSFESNFESWTNNGMATQTNTSFSIKDGSVYVEKWVSNTEGSNVPDVSVTQTITEIPNGSYILKANAQSIRQPATASTGGYIFAGSKTTEVGLIDEYTVYDILVVNQTLTIGFKTENATANWVGVDHFRLYYLGLDLTNVKSELEALITTAQAYAESKMQATVATELAGAIAQAQEAVQADPLVEIDLNAAIVRLTTANAAALESIAVYATLKEAIDAANANKTDYADYAGYADFEAAIATAAAAYESATLNEEGITAAIEALKAAELACRLTQETPFDATFAILNPSFEAGSRKIADGSGGGTVNAPDSWDVEYDLSGWNDVKVVANSTEDNPVDGDNFFNAWADIVTKLDLYQSITLPAGQYTLSASMRTEKAAQISNQHIYAKIGDNTIQSNVLTFSPAVNESVTGDWKKSEAWQLVSVTFNVPDGGSAVRIGASSAGGTESVGWFQLDHFQLTSNGNFNAAIATLQTLLATAETLTGRMQTGVETELATAVAEATGAIETPSTAVLEAAIERLTAAVEAAESSIEAYHDLITAIQTANANKANYTDYPGYDDFVAAIAVAQAAYDAKELDEAGIEAAIAALLAAEQTCINSGGVGIRYPGSGAIVISGEKNGIRIQSNGSGAITIYGTNGQLLKTSLVSKGTSFVSLTSGVYVVNGKKIIVK